MSRPSMPLSATDAVRVLLRAEELEKRRLFAMLGGRPLTDAEVEDLASAHVATEAEPEHEPVGVEAPKPKASPREHTKDRRERLAAVLDAIEARAHECGVPLVRTWWPGTKAEFRAFLEWYAPRLLWALPTDDDRLTDELHPHGVAFGKPGRARDKGKKIYQELFPDYPA